MLVFVNGGDLYCNNLILIEMMEICRNLLKKVFKVI